MKPLSRSLARGKFSRKAGGVRETPPGPVQWFGIVDDVHGPSEPSEGIRGLGLRI